MKIDADTSILHEIKDYFTFDVPGAKWSPKFKAGVWDGKISLINFPACNMYMGLLPLLKEFCDVRDYELDISPKLLETDNLSPKEIFEFVKSLNVHSNGQKLTVKDYQLASVFTMLQKRRLTLLSPTSSGKSLIIYLIIRWLLTNEKQILLIVPNIGLTGQMFSDFQDYSTENGFEVYEYCQIIAEGASKEISKSIVISTWQSIYKQPASWINQFDAIICDEVHLAQANSIRTMMENATKVKYRFGLTGTLKDTKTHEWVISGLFGPIKRFVSTADLIERGDVSDISITCLVLEYSDKEECKVLKRAEYSDEIQYLAKHSKRNDIIASLAINCKGNTLILYQLIDHGKFLFDLISDKVKERKVFLINGSINGDERNEIRTIVEQEENAIIVASYGTTSTGTSIKKIHNIIAASPTKSVIRLLQSIGRGLRKAEGKTHFKWYDIVDDFSGGKGKCNTTYDHFIKRLEIYTSESFNYKISKLII